jgi:hypothetical protein
MRDDLETLHTATFRSFITEDGTPRSLRTRVRYLAALLPNAPLPQLAESLHGVITNADLSVADLRLVLEGRHLNDPSRRTREVDIVKVQQAGALLAKGQPQVTVAKTVGVSVDTVRAIDEYLGLSERYEERILDAAYDAIREGWSVRRYADNVGISRSRAHRTLQKARAVLVELGEVSA